MAKWRAVWLDDERDPKKHDFYQGPDVLVTWVKSVPEFKEAFLRIVDADPAELLAVSFDNDLGRRDGEGRDAFRWMEEVVRERNLPRFRVKVHTRNAAAGASMRQGVQALKDFWFRGSQVQAPPPEEINNVGAGGSKG